MRLNFKCVKLSFFALTYWGERDSDSSRLPRLGWAEAGRQELHPGLPGGFQDSTTYPLASLARVCYRREAEMSSWSWVWNLGPPRWDVSVSSGVLTTGPNASL